MKTHLSSDITIRMVNFVMMNLNTCNSMPLQILCPQTPCPSPCPQILTTKSGMDFEGFRLGFSHRQGFFGLNTKTTE